MTIQIDQSLFLPKIKSFSESRHKRRKFQDSLVDLGRDVLDDAQGWFDEQPWRFGVLENYDTQRECRIELKRYITKKIDLSDRNKSWFVPNIIFIWIAKELITYIIKQIIEHYWPDLVDEMGLEL